ncbi:MAG: 5-formyltetrahydrofolate cyclo-ligase [Pseudomonadota bacterium]
MNSKADLRKTLRAARKAHVLAQPDSIKALLFNHPPRPILDRIADDAVIGLYHSTADEAPASGYARFFHERGHRIALPAFTSDATPMRFAQHTDPFGENDLKTGPFGLHQPGGDVPDLLPDILFMPLIGFTASGKRLGQGGGHFDRWLAEHPGRIKIGLAWDVQLIEPEDILVTEPHDVALDCIVTPTRIYGNL